MIGPQVPYCDDVHRQKYRLENETFKDAIYRVASGLKDSDDHYHELKDILLDQRFLPGGRVQTAIGTNKTTTAYNCFVSGSISDSLVHDEEGQLGGNSIMWMAVEAAATMRMGGGIGYDFSTLRPEGDRIKKLNSNSTGPLSFMKVYDALCNCIASSGHRRGAQMGVLRVDHPDIRKFITAKNDQHSYTGFNMSVAVTDEFMEAVAKGSSFTLRWGGREYEEVDARELWEMIMRSTWDYAEPGVLFIDRINALNNLYYCENIAATNPCGEQPLPPYGACLLGSFNLTRYIRSQGETRYFDWDQFGADIAPVVRGMDNVVDRTNYPLHQQRVEAQSKRRMGLGITGLANAAEAMGMPYGSARFLKFEFDVLRRLRRETYRASAMLAAEKGAFPLYDKELYGKSQFLANTFGVDGDTEVLDLIAKHGIRNSHLTSIAPTGTISLSADNISGGIEPTFAKSVKRRVNMLEGPRNIVLEDYGVRVWGTDPRTTEHVTVQEHVDVLLTAAQQVDSAVSKTCNLDGSCPWDDFKGIYLKVWEGGGKGCTTFNKDGERFGIMEAAPQAEDQTEGQSCSIDPATGRRDCA